MTTPITNQDDEYDLATREIMTRMGWNMFNASSHYDEDEGCWYYDASYDNWDNNINLETTKTGDTEMEAEYNAIQEIETLYNMLKEELYQECKRIKK